jgi:adenosylhomocysteine nucleosidase
MIGLRPVSIKEVVVLRPIRKSVYHWLRPRNEVVILTALDLEFRAVRSHLSGPQTWRHPEGTLFETGRMNRTGRSIAVARTGQGNTPTALIAERAIGMFRPRALLFVGVAGGLRADVGLGDVVVATKVYAFHGGKTESGQFLPRPQVWEAPHGLEQLAGYLAGRGEWTSRLTCEHREPRVHLKPIAGGDVVVNCRTSEIAEQLRRYFDDAVAVDMESVGAACAGHLNASLPVLSIRGISDHADGSKEVSDRAGWQVEAASHAAAFALALAAAMD